MLTIIGCFIFNIQTILEDKTDGMEFNRSTQIVFSLEKRETSSYDTELYPSYVNNSTENLDDIDIEAEIMSRLDLAGVRNANVSIVNGVDNTGYELRITLAPYSRTELNNIINIISRTGYLSVATTGDQNIMTQDNSDFFASDVASIVYDGTTPYPTLNIGSDADFQTMKTAAEEAADNTGSADSSTDSSDETTDENSDSSSESTKLYIWYNKTLDDTYDKAYGTNDVVVDEDVLKKVVATINVDDYDAETHTVPITSDIDGNAFTISTARALVNLLNAPDYGFNISYLYQNTVAPSFGNNAINILYICIAVAIILIAIILILIYGLAGLTSFLSLLSSAFLSLILASALGFEFSIAAISALFVLFGLSTLISVNYFEHVKIEIKKGRDLEKSNQEGYHKSFFLSLDVSIITFAVSLFSFLLASGSYQVFFGVAMIGSVVTFLLTNYLNRFITYFLVKNNDKKLPYFSLLSFKQKSDKTVSTKGKKAHKFIALAIPAFAAVLAAIALPVNYALNNNIFNNTGSYSDTYTLNISFETERNAYEELDNVDSFLLYIETIGTSGAQDERFEALDSNNLPSELPAYYFIYYPETAYVNTVEKTNEDGIKYFINYYSVQVDRDLSLVTLENVDANVLNVIQNTVRDGEVTINLSPDTSYSAVLVAPGHDAEFISNSLSTGCYLTTPTNVTHQINNLFLILFLIPVFAAIYALIRYGLNMGITTLATGAVSGLLFTGLLAALQIPFTSFTSYGLLVSLMLLLICLIPPLYMNHILIKESNARYSSDEIKASIVNESFSRLFKISILPIVINIVLFISLVFVNSSLLGLTINSIVDTLLILPMIVFFGVVIYFYLFKHLSFKKWHDKYVEFKSKKGKETKTSTDGIVYVDPDSPHETIIPGLNDFLH